MSDAMAGCAVLVVGDVAYYRKDDVERVIGETVEGCADFQRALAITALDQRDAANQRAERAEEARAAIADRLDLERKKRDEVGERLEACVAQRDRAVAFAEAMLPEEWRDGVCPSCEYAASNPGHNSWCERGVAFDSIKCLLAEVAKEKEGGAG